MVVIDRWTTQFGSWDVDISHEFGIDLIHEQKYRNEDIPGKGADHHILVKASPGDTVRFNTAGGENPSAFLVGDTRWVNFPMFASSAYNPDRGERGPWEVYVNNIRVADGIGLPGGLHVSTFLVVDEDNLGSGPTPPVQDKDKIQLIVNGVTVWSN
jgi:hypothetical protein